jgi:murein DD-endopeptidase MepM/ murein hydrolase activator NlpD
MKRLPRVLLALALVLPGANAAAQAAATPTAPAGPSAPTVASLPAQPLLVQGRDGQDLNFDLLFDNPGATALQLVGVEATWYGRDGRFLGQRRLDRNGDDTTMGIATVRNRTLPAHGRLVLFNPFQHFPANAWLGDVRYEAVFSAGDDAPEQRVALRVAPRAWQPKTVLSLPLAGPVFVHDGHDFTAHHRRLDITGGMTTHFGIRANFMRYAHDFVVADGEGKLYRGDGAKPEDWYGYGAPILATGDGVVVEMHDGMADNRKGGAPPFDREAIMKNLKLFLGNYAIIDHGNGEFSLFAHMRQGSVKVHPGQRVARGEQVGAMGMSGDAFLVHLHYQLQSDAGFGEGLPAVFEGVRFATGTADGWTAPAASPVDSGDLVLSAAPR